MTSIDLRQVRYFVAIADELHFGRAARNLGIAQPALSQQIQRFERDIGMRLFERNRRSVRLTPAGMMLLAEARILLDQAGRLETLIAGVAAGSAGELIIGFVGSAALMHLPNLIARFRSAWPDVTLSLREMSTAEQLPALDAGDIHVACMRVPVASAGEQALLLAREPLVLAAPELPGRDLPDPVPLSLLANAAFILPPRQLGHSFHETVVSACLRAGFLPNIAQEAVQMQTIVGLVAAGIGVSLVPASVANSRHERVIWRAVDDPAAHTDLTLVWRNSQLPLVRRLLELVEGGGAATISSAGQIDSALHSRHDLPE